MSQNIDNPPLKDPLTKGGDSLSEIWMGYISQFIATMQSYLSERGIAVPRITTDQRNSLQDVENGQMIYNTTLNKFQGYENGAWVNFV